MYSYPLQEPVIPGSFLRARAIGLMPMIDQVFMLHSLWINGNWSPFFQPFSFLNMGTVGCCQGEKDDKIIAVCADDPEYRHYNDISELSPHRLQEIKRFFEDCILNSCNVFLLHSLVCYARSHSQAHASLAVSFRQEKWEQRGCCRCILACDHCSRCHSVLHVSSVLTFAEYGNAL